MERGQRDIRKAVYRMYIMDSEQAGDTGLSCHGRDKTGHPVVAMDEIRPYFWDDIVYNLTLKRKRTLFIFQAGIRVQAPHMVKGPIFCKVDSFTGHPAPYFIQLISTPYIKQPYWVHSGISCFALSPVNTSVAEVPLTKSRLLWNTPKPKG